KDVIRATPERMAIAAESVPELIFIFAHLGGMNQWDDAERYVVGRLDNVYLDVSVIAGYIKDEQLLRIIRNHGADKILFGSDCPWDLPSNEITMINRLPLSDEEKEKIFHKNAENLLLID
ncbi:MAG: amidohydrolase family protein, partial [Acutalibacteraceae bacterium]